MTGEGTANQTMDIVVALDAEHERQFGRPSGIYGKFNYGWETKLSVITEALRRGSPVVPEDYQVRQNPQTKS